MEGGAKIGTSVEICGENSRFKKSYVARILVLDEEGKARFRTRGVRMTSDERTNAREREEETLWRGT